MLTNNIDKPFFFFLFFQKTDLQLSSKNVLQFYSFSKNRKEEFDLLTTHREKKKKKRKKATAKRRGMKTCEGIEFLGTADVQQHLDTEEADPQGAGPRHFKMECMLFFICF